MRGPLSTRRPSEDTLASVPGTPPEGARAPRQPPPEVSLVIPVYNEEGNIAALLEAIRSALDPLLKPWEAVLVDDGSTDRTGERLAAEAARDSRIRILRFRKNAGQSAALSAGFDAASAPVIVTLDADLQNDPRDIPALLEKIPEWDAVCGWRAGRQDSFIRRLSAFVANRVRNALTRDNIRDTGCSLKAFRREALERVHRFVGMHRFLPTLVRMQGFRVVEVPVRHHPRRAGRSKYGVWNRAFRGLIDLLGVWWLKRRAIRARVEQEVDSK